MSKDLRPEAAKGKLNWTSRYICDKCNLRFFVDYHTEPLTAFPYISCSTDSSLSKSVEISKKWDLVEEDYEY
jgi:hypothetical protein